MHEICNSVINSKDSTTIIDYVDYTDESMLKDIQQLVAKDLSEPYSIFTYRYFLHQWPNLCICAYTKDSSNDNTKELVGTVISKAEEDHEGYRGYIGMLAVNSNFRKNGIGSRLVEICIERLIQLGCDEIFLETEATNTSALRLYEKLGFIRDEKLGRYYLNGGDAYRLRLWIDKSKFVCDSELNMMQNINIS